MRKVNDNNKLAIQMLIAMVSGILVGLGFMTIRESVGADSALWTSINNILFQNITAAGGEQALGLFYIGGQLFIRSLQLVIVPMVFSSVVMAICEVNEARTLGRIAGKTMGWFMMTTTIALTLAGAVALACFKMGFFHVQVDGLTGSAGSTGSNPLLVILNIVPSNIGATFSVNNSVLAVVFLAVVVGLDINTLNLGKDCVIYRLCDEASKIVVVFLNFIVKKFGPTAIFMLLCNTFATYGIDYLKPAAVYVVLTVALLLAYLFIAGCGGYDVTLFQLVIIMVLALIASMGTPAAPGAGAVILFTILSGMGFTGEQALIAYSLILAINRPIEMLVTALNVTGDALTSMAVAKSEGKLNEDIYNK